MRREMRSKWLQTACLNVIIAAVCYNPPLSILLLQRPLADTGGTLLAEIIHRWLANAAQLIGYDTTTATTTTTVLLILLLLTRHCLLIYTVFRKRHPLTFCSISPWKMFKFPQNF